MHAISAISCWQLSALPASRALLPSFAFLLLNNGPREREACGGKIRIQKKGSQHSKREFEVEEQVSRVLKQELQGEEEKRVMVVLSFGRSCATMCGASVCLSVCPCVCVYMYVSVCSSLVGARGPCSWSWGSSRVHHSVPGHFDVVPPAGGHVLRGRFRGKGGTDEDRNKSCCERARGHGSPPIHTLHLPPPPPAPLPHLPPHLVRLPHQLLSHTSPSPCLPLPPAPAGHPPRFES